MLSLTSLLRVIAVLLTLGLFENRRRDVISLKWLRMGFEPMPAPTRDVLWYRGRGNP